MDSIINQDIIKIIIIGLGMASAWYWCYSLITRKLNSDDLKKWLSIIIPQGILIAFALYLGGLL